MMKSKARFTKQTIAEQILDKWYTLEFLSQEIDLYALKELAGAVCGGDGLERRIGGIKRIRNRLLMA